MRTTLYFADLLKTVSRRGVVAALLLGLVLPVLSGCTNGTEGEELDEAKVKAEAAAEVEKEITEENAEAALDELEKEIDADLSEEE